MPSTLELQKSHKHIPLWLFLLLLAIVIANGFGMLWQARMIRAQWARIAQRDKENFQLQHRVEDLVRAQAAPARVPPPAPASVRSLHGTSPETLEALAEAENRNLHLRESLAQSNTELTHLQGMISDLQTQLQTTAGENKQLSAALDEEKKELAEEKQTVEDLRADVNTNVTRIAELDAANARFKSDAATGKQSAVELSKTFSDLEGLFRRREMYLSSVVRRYREMTEQYRAMAGLMDSRRDREGTVISGTEISHIQNAVALADEELRQISVLNVQAQRLEKKLPAR
jgi:chromosome segregation ATPase